MKTIDRRTFIGMAVCAGIGARTAWGWQPPKDSLDPPERFFDWKKARDDAWVAFGYGGNSLVLRGRDGAILVDCKNAPYAKALRREAQAQGGLLRAVINTHHHADHTGGNHTFVGDIDSYCHEKATPRILAQMNRYISQAKEAADQWGDRTGPVVEQVRREAVDFYHAVTRAKATDFAPRTGVGEARTLEVAGIKIELRHFGPGHTDNDLVVFVPSMNLLHAGDLLFHRIYPYVDVPAGATTVGWQEAVRKTAAMCDDKTIVIPGHGELTDRAGLLAQAEFFERLREVVNRAIEAGKSRKDIAEMDTGLYKDYDRIAWQGMTLTALYDEAMKNRAR
jgi:cyclase